MKKRLIAAFMVAVIVVSMCTPFTLAVTPADPLIASALYSFVLSAGIKLFRDGGIEGTEDLVTDMQALYARYKTEQGTYSDWDAMGQGIIYNAGNFIYTRDTAQTLQSFTNWLGEKIGNVPDTENVIIERQSGPQEDEYEIVELSGLTNLQNGVWSLPLYTYDLLDLNVYVSSGSFERGEPTYAIQVHSGGDSIVCFITAAPNGNKYTRWVSLSNFTANKINYTYHTDENGDRIQEIASVEDYQVGSNTITGTYVKNDGNSFKYYSTGVAGSYNIEYPVSNSFSDVNKYSKVLLEMGYVALAGQKEEQPALPSGSIVGRLSNAILDVAHNIADQGALAIDIGASASTTEEEAIETVIGDYAEPVSVAIPEAIATPIPAEGVSELYPQPATTDVESLGLPALGQALTSRFPFCIPFDVVSVYKSLNATAVCPVINVDLFPASFKNKIGVTGNTSFTIDFGDQRYSLFIQLIHWGSLVGFIIMLAFATKRLIWTTGG